MAAAAGAAGRAVTPGDVVAGPGPGWRAGAGCYADAEGLVRASVVGTVRVAAAAAAGPAEDGGAGREVSVETAAARGARVPRPGDEVLAQVTRVTPKLANADILCLGGQALPHAFAAQIRVQDVRATEIDKVQIHASFRPGDVVRAEVISLGDARSYFMSTAKAHLGVLYAKSVDGEVMVPVNWELMEDPNTKAREPRKVAKVL